MKWRLIGVLGVSLLACSDAGEMTGGATVKLGPIEFAFYANSYRFDEYIEVMNESILAPQA